MRYNQNLPQRMFRKYGSLVVFLTTFTLGCSGESPVEPVIADNVTVLGDDTAQAAVVEEDQIALPLLGHESLLALAPGQILASGYGDGFLRQVVRVEQTGDQIVIHTVNARLTDAVVAGAINATLDIEAPPPASSSSMPYALSGESLSKGLDLSKTKLMGGGGLEVEITEGRIKFDPSLQFHLLIAGGKLKEFKLVGTGTLEAALTVEVAAAVGVSAMAERTLWTSPPKKFIQFIGPVPVVEVVTIALKAGVRVEAGGENKVKAGARATASLSLGVSYQDGEWDAIDEHPLELVGIGPEVAVETGLKMRAYMRPEVEVKFYAVAGPALSVEPYAAFELEAVPPPVSWRLLGGVKGDVAVNIEVLGHIFAKFNAQIFDFHKVFRQSAPVLVADGGADGSVPDAAFANRDLASPDGLPSRGDGGEGDGGLASDMALLPDLRRFPDLLPPPDLMKMVPPANTISFPSATTFPAGGEANALATADFNRDGKLDLVVVNTGINGVNIIIGNGDGTFQLDPNTYVTGRSPYGVATADFNNDQKTDIAVSNDGDATVSVLLGKGDGTFQGATNFATRGSIWLVRTVDLNADGNADLMVGYDNGGISVFLGKGDGTFQPRADYATDRVRGLAVSDFNGDKHLDVLASGVEVLLGVGNGTLKARAAIPDSPNIGYVAAGDFNNDGKMDAVVVGQPVAVMLGNGDGTFQKLINTAVPVSGYMAVAADLNRDGRIDIVIPNGDSGDVGILIGLGNGSFQPEINYATGGSSYRAVVADFNNDGVLDIVVDSNSNLAILAGKGDGTVRGAINYRSESDVGAGSSSFHLGARDLNGDGRLDLAVLTSRSIQTLLGDGLGGFGLTGSFPVGVNPVYVETGDLNGDGSQDLVVGLAPYGKPSDVSVLLNKGNATFFGGVNYPAGSGLNSMAIADLDGDGNSDVVTVGNREVQVLLGKGDGTLQMATGFAWESVLSGMAVADLNRDGKMDIVAGAGREVVVFLSKGDGSLLPGMKYAANPNGLVNSLVAVDLNNDSKVDIATANGSDKSISVLLGKGDGSFHPSSIFTAKAEVAWLVVGDFNNNGKPDLAFREYRENKVGVFNGQGDGTFQFVADFTVGNWPASLRAADFNGDGRLDLVTPNSKGGNVTILLNDSK